MHCVFPMSITVGSNCNAAGAGREMSIAGTDEVDLNRGQMSWVTSGARVDDIGSERPCSSQSSGQHRSCQPLFREMKLELLSRKADPQVELRGGIFECRTPFPGGVYTSRNSWEVRLRDAGTRYCQPRPQQLRGLIRSKFFKDGNFVLEDQGTPSNASVRRSIL